MRFYMPHCAAGAIAALAVTAAFTPAAHADVIDFGGLEHGRIVTNQFLASHKVAIRAINPNRSHDIAAIYNTLNVGGADPDLEGPVWSGGNLAPGTVLGNALIISQNNTGAGDGILDNPNDEGNRPAGQLIFEFQFEATSFGLDFIDIEGPNVEATFLRFFDGGAGGTQLAEVSLAEFIHPMSSFYDPTIAFGDTSANRITPINASDLGLVSFDTVVIAMGGSGGVDTITFVPAPSALALAGLGGLAAVRRRR